MNIEKMARIALIFVLLTFVPMIGMGTYLGNQMEYAYETGGGGPATDVVKLGSQITPEATVSQGWDDNSEEIMEAIKTVVERAGVKDGMLQTEAIQLINDYLCEKTVYGENRYCRTVRGSLVLHQAVCVGYALGFQYVAQYCGINAVYVHGSAKGVRHGWNGVYFSDGTYLEVDVTFNDTSGNFHKYLLITHEEMEALHNPT